MKGKDFDMEVQKIFNKSFRKWKNKEWKNWLDIKSNEEYEDSAFKASGMIDREEFAKNLKTTITNSREFSINKENYKRQIH